MDKNENSGQTGNIQALNALDTAKQKAIEYITFQDKVKKGGISNMYKILIDHHSPRIDVLKSDNQLQLLQDITKLKLEKNDLLKKLVKETNHKEKLIKEFEEKSAGLEAKEKTNHILSRITGQAGNKILEGDILYASFEDGTNCDSVVVSIDIRRSTELMLKAKTPKQFSLFITELSKKLSGCIIDNYGIFDKFTGDGILAFFPKFYSGDNAIIRALKAAELCHEIFDDHYNKSRSSFNVFIKDVGLGIGIDYGNVTLVNTSSELTVVGIPVVYACRMSGANAGDTLLNQGAKDEILNLIPDNIKIVETELFIKNEGTAVAYNVDVNVSVYNNLKDPEWTQENKLETIDNDPE